MRIFVGQHTTRLALFLAHLVGATYHSTVLSSYDFMCLRNSVSWIHFLFMRGLLTDPTFVYDG